MTDPPAPPPDGHAPPEDHRAWREELGAYALDQLDAAERAAVGGHLDSCADCRAELATIAVLVPVLSRVDPDSLRPRRDGVAVTPVPATPPDLDEQVLRRIRGEPRPAARSGGRHRGRPLGLLIAAGVAVVAAAAGGVVLGEALGAPPVEPVAAVAAPALQADIGVIAHTWGVEVRLTGRGFADGAPYRASVIDSSGRPVDAGSFVGTGPDEMECHLTAEVLRADATRVSIADATGREVVSAVL